MNLTVRIFLLLQLVALAVSLFSMWLDVSREPIWTWRLVNRSRLKIQFQLELRDAWFGFFWNRTDIALHLYICVIPLVPLHVTIARV